MSSLLLFILQSKQPKMSYNIFYKMLDVNCALEVFRSDQSEKNPQLISDIVSVLTHPYKAKLKPQIIIDTNIFYKIREGIVKQKYVKMFCNHYYTNHLPLFISLVIYKLA